MTGAGQTPVAPSAGARAQLRADLARIVAVGAPLLVNNLSSIGVTVGDTLMASRLGSTQLAAVAIGSGVWIVLFLLGLGTIMALGPTVAQHFGAGHNEAIGHDTRQGFWLALVVTAVVITGMRSTAPLLAWMHIDAQVAALAQGYLDALCWGVGGAYSYHTLKQMSEGVGRTVPIMAVMLAALPLNILLDYTFMYGRFGAPALGAVGCGLGAGISFWIMFLMLAFHTWRSPHYQSFRVWRALERPDFAALGRLVALGLPIGLSLFLQSGLFTAVALMMGSLGTVAVAAHQVVLNYSGFVFMLPLGFAMALTVCVGQAVGREDYVGARRIGLTGMVLCTAITLVSGTTTLLFASSIARIYTADAAVITLALLLFKVAALLQVGDGIQVAAGFALRGFKDTRMPLVLNAFSYWGVGFVLAYVLGMRWGYGPRGIWIGLTTALWAGGIVLVGRFLVLSRRLITTAPRVSP